MRGAVHPAPSAFVRATTLEDRQVRAVLRAAASAMTATNFSACAAEAPLEPSSREDCLPPGGSLKPFPLKLQQPSTTSEVGCVGALRLALASPAPG